MMPTAAPQDEGVLCGGGTLDLPQLTARGRAWRLAEMALLFLAAPFAVNAAVHDHGVPVFIALLPVLAAILFFLASDRTFSLARELSRGFSTAQLGSILLIFAVGAGIVAAYVSEYHPALFLGVSPQSPGNLPAHHAALSADVRRRSGVRLPHVLLPCCHSTSH